MSKTPVHSPAAGKRASAKKPARATPIAPASRSVPKTARAKSSAVTRAPAKAAPKAPHKAPTEAHVKAHAKAPVKAAARAATIRAAPKAAPRAASKAEHKPTPRPAVVPALPSAPVNRFSERFSPVRPAARGQPEPMEIHKTAIKADPKLVNAWKSKSGSELSEPELLAMPESEYMNETQREFFRTRLKGLKDALLSNAGQTTEHLREDTSIVPDPADRATIEEEHSLELRTRDRERKLLKKIMQSLARIESGDYGFCDETGEPIGLRRLLARPTATLSLEAQQRRELKQKMFGD